MASFSPTDAALEGFRLTREHPRSVVMWAACSLGFAYAVDLIAWLTLGPNREALVQDFLKSASDPNLFWPAAAKLAPFFLIGLPFNLAFQSIFTCAVYRAVLRPTESARGYLRLGVDELRMAALNVIFALILAATLFAVGMVAALAGAAAAGAPSLVVLVGDLVTIAAFWAGVIVLLRLSLAGPMTFAERRLVVFDSWRLTRGIGLRLFWTYALAMLLGGFAFGLMLLIVFALLAALAALGLPLEQAAEAGKGPVFLATSLVLEAVQAAMLTCFYVVWKAPAAQAYKALAHPDVAGTFA
ncbi:MAG TPA: hypothetical protein VKU90_14155 [Caulobacteraceae bacterium]|jgi:hypothetical protein|nr:hypothetical protein [Caulobacteraceae bacterium]